MSDLGEAEVWLCPCTDCASARARMTAAMAEHPGGNPCMCHTCKTTKYRLIEEFLTRQDQEWGEEIVR